MADKQSIRFKIRQDGIVEEKVEGVAGDACENLTKDLEKKLGDLTRRIHTSDYYKSQNTVSDVTLQHNQDQN
tara:strand:- start:1832 stop:2047 length:216 start_codon:yes stop_codon:yes gene_type:complete